MDVRIGIMQSPRELTFEIDTSADEIVAKVQQAEIDKQRFISFTDVKGNQYVVNTESIAYLECGGDAARRVGFFS